MPGAQSGIYEGAGPVKRIAEQVGAPSAEEEDVLLSASARHQGGGVKVQRPQSPARTNDLEADAGGAMLSVEDVSSVVSSR
jgi:hypothetical protein